MENYSLITVLCTLLGFAGGVGTAFFGILKKINKTDINVSTHTEQIKTLFGNEKETNSRHEKMLALLNTIVNQNTLLIQKFRMEP